MAESDSPTEPESVVAFKQKILCPTHYSMHCIPGGYGTLAGQVQSWKLRPCEALIVNSFMPPVHIMTIVTIRFFECSQIQHNNRMQACASNDAGINEDSCPIHGWRSCTGKKLQYAWGDTDMLSGGSRQ